MVVPVGLRHDELARVEVRDPGRCRVPSFTVRTSPLAVARARPSGLNATRVDPALARVVPISWTSWQIASQDRRQADTGACRQARGSAVVRARRALASQRQRPVRSADVLRSVRPVRRRRADQLADDSPRPCSLCQLGRFLRSSRPRLRVGGRCSPPRRRAMRKADHRDQGHRDERAATAAARPATTGLRRHQSQVPLDRPTGRAWIGSPPGSAPGRRPAARRRIPPRGSFSRHFRQMISRSRGSRG